MNDKQFVNELINICNEIIKHGELIKKRKKKEKDLKPLFSNLAKLLEARFNIKYEVTSMPFSVLATFPPINSYGSSVSLINYKHLLQLHQFEDLVNLLKNNDKVYKEDLGFYIDFKNKEIIYKGKNKFQAIVIIEPIELWNAGLTGEELAAALLHEIGHDFEFLRYSLYVTRKLEHIIDIIRNETNKSDLLDKIIDVVVNHNDKKEVDVKELDFKDKLEIIFNLPIKIFEYSSKEYMERYNLTDVGVTFKEFETVADRFVTDFNLSHYLASGVNKLRIHWTVSQRISNYIFDKYISVAMYRMFTNIFGDKYVAALYVIILGDLIYNSIIYPIVSNILGNLDSETLKELNLLTENMVRLVFIINNLILLKDMLNFTLTIEKKAFILIDSVILISNYINNYREKGGLPTYSYEDDELRVDSIKRNIIEKLKNVKDPETKKMYLEQLEHIDRELKHLRKSVNDFKIIGHMTNIVNIIGLFRDPSKLNPIYILTRTVKEHINNDLYIQAAKLEFKDTREG